MSREQNYTLSLDDSTSGVYFCHASVSGFDSVVSRACEVRANAPPSISSPTEQSGVLGSDVQLDCAAVSVPEPRDMHWTYHGQRLDDSQFRTN